MYWNHVWHVLLTSEFFALNQPAIDLGVCHFRILVCLGDILAVLSAFKLSVDSMQNVSTEVGLRVDNKVRIRMQWTRIVDAGGAKSWVGLGA